MSEIERIQRIGKKVLVIWDQYPEMRFFQLMSFIQIQIMERSPDMDMFSVEDWELEEALDNFITWDLKTPE